MRKIVTTLAALALLATGAVITAPPAAATGSQYVLWVRANVDGAYAIPRAEIIRAGRLVCRSIDGGMEPIEVGETIVDAGFAEDEAAAWVVGAVYFLCPRHKWMI